MSNDHIQRQMDFIVAQQAKFSVDIEEMKESHKRLDAMIERMAKEAEVERRETREAINHLNDAVNGLNNAVSGLSGTVINLSGTVSSLSGSVSSLSGTVNSVIIEMRDGFNNLIIANEVTRELASQAAKLAIQNSERLNRLEGRPGS